MKLSSNERTVHCHAYQCLIIQDTKNCWKIVLQDIYPRPDISMSAFLVWPIIVSTLLITNAYQASVLIHTTTYFGYMTGKSFGPWVKRRNDKEKGDNFVENDFFLFYFVFHFLEKEFCDCDVVADHKLDPTFAIVWQCKRVCKICQFSPLGTIPNTRIIKRIDENTCSMLKSNQINIESSACEINDLWFSNTSFKPCKPH